MAATMTKSPSESVGASDLVSSMVVYDISAYSAGATNVYCGFFPSKVVIYEDGTVEKILSWNAAMGASLHFDCDTEVDGVAAAMVTALAADDAAANGNGFVLGAVLTASGFVGAYMEVYR